MERRVGLAVLTIVSSALTVALLITAAWAATGVVSLDKDTVTTPGGVVTITLTDFDLNFGVQQVAETTDFSGNGYAVPAGLASGATFFQRVQKFPILDNNANGIVNFQDVVVNTTTAPTISVLSVDTNGGLVTFRSNTGVALAGGTFTVTYTAADVQTHTVEVTSIQDATGFDITVNETGSNTGVFVATFQTGPSTVFLLQGGILASDIGVDLNGNGTTSDTVTANAGSPVSEVTARVDADGDVLTTGVLDVMGVDLNGDGDALDAGVDSVNVAGLPDSPTRPVIAASDGAVITVTYDDSGTSRVDTVTASGEPEPTATPIPTPTATPASCCVGVVSLDKDTVTTAGGVVKITLKPPDSPPR